MEATLEQFWSGLQQNRVTFLVRLWYLENDLMTNLCMSRRWLMVRTRKVVCMKSTSHVLNICITKVFQQHTSASQHSSSWWWNTVSIPHCYMGVRTKCYLYRCSNQILAGGKTNHQIFRCPKLDVSTRDMHGILCKWLYDWCRKLLVKIHHRTCEWQFPLVCIHTTLMAMCIMATKHERPLFPILI